jgi:hypothetical protein
VFKEGHHWHNFANSKKQAQELDQTCISSKSIMCLPKTILLDSSIFIEKKGGETTVAKTFKNCCQKKKCFAKPACIDDANKFEAKG